MAVGDLAREVVARVNEQGVELQDGVCFRWLSGKGHLEYRAREAPSIVRERLAEIHQVLRGDGSVLSAKRTQLLPMDFLFGSFTLVEIDEYQHFTSPRLATLDFYDGLEHGLDVDGYRSLCRGTAARADKYRRAKTAADFPFVGGRAAQRAYLDAVRDLLAPAFGYRVIRIPAVDHDGAVAAEELLQRLSRYARCVSDSAGNGSRPPQSRSKRRRVIGPSRTTDPLIETGRG